MSFALDVARTRAPAGDDTFRGEYLRALRLIERLHRCCSMSSRTSSTASAAPSSTAFKRCCSTTWATAS